VALIDDPSDTSILPRLQAELTGLGLEVALVARKDDEQLPRDLVEAARNTDAVAAFRIVLADGHADVWIADRVTGKVVLREMLPRGAQIDGRVVALRALELLRVSLMELDIRKPPAEDAPMRESLPQSSALLQDLERSSLTAESAFLWSPGGTGVAIGFDAALAWRPSWIGLRWFGGSVLGPARISRPEGTGEATTRWIGLDAIVQPRRTRLRLRPRAGIGLAALSTEYRGVANATWVSRQQTVYTLAPRISADLGWALHSRLRIEVGLSYFRPLRGQDLMVVDRTVGTYGVDVFVASLGLDLALP
jgi:hypothetical protein